MCEVRLETDMSADTQRALRESCALAASSDVHGAVAEVGVRAGGGFATLASALWGTHLQPGPFVLVDPYGDLPFPLGEDVITTFRYTDELYRHAMAMVALFAQQWELDVTLFRLTDADFMDRFAEGVPRYFSDGSQFCTEYAVVHLDGPHDLKSVLAETQFFMRRMRKGAVLVYDDVYAYDHFEVDALLLDSGWERHYLNDKNSATYQREEDS